MSPLLSSESIVFHIFSKCAGSTGLLSDTGATFALHDQRINTPAESNNRIWYFIVVHYRILGTDAWGTKITER